ncbi:MAG: leucyl aminopeptidase [Gemmatimonadetes bacterium]|nr:MAG: leucyl aminopeptidase [Gemmatimonadota bacterium]
MLQLNVKKGDITQETAEMIVVNHFEDSPELAGAIAKLDQMVEGDIQRLIELGDFTGAFNETILLRPKGLPFNRVLVVGMGKKADLTAERIRQVAANVASKATGWGMRTYSSILHGCSQLDEFCPVTAQAFAEGTVLGAYRFTAYKTNNDPKSSRLETVTVVELDEGVIEAIEDGIQRGQTLAEGVCYARDLGNHPANLITPSYLADQAKTIAKTHKLKCTILDHKEMEKRGMNCILAVSSGSAEPPKLIILEYQSGNPDAPTVAVVGKGITFDSGGLGIKTLAGMIEMKFDMCGAAATLALAQVMGTLRPSHVNLVFAVAAAENMIGEKSYRPSDILTAYNGKTIEIRSTDAEGRLVLADALAYVAERYRPAAMFDLATLTGGCVVALGRVAAGMFSRDAGLIQKLAVAADKTHEKVWELPMFEEYEQDLKSTYADIKNGGVREGSPIFAAWFLKQFTGDVPWAHLDIAGTAVSKKNKGYFREGATGFGVRLLAQLIEDWK